MPNFARNHCKASEICRFSGQVDLVESSPNSKAAKTAEATTARTAAHNLSEEAKLKIVQAYAHWVEHGRKIRDCPVEDLMKQFRCSKNTPKRLYDRMLTRGTLANKWSGGRSKVYGVATDEHIREAIRLRRADQ
eukprot:10712239-Prorocentrum_lima.AAC.1